MTINYNKSSFWWNFVLKSTFAVILSIFLYRQLVHNNDLSNSWDYFLSSLNSNQWSYLVVCILLMPINWLLESVKWKNLVDPFEKITFLTSAKAVLSGISIALLTPNRIGEYGGRMVVVEAKNNWKAVISTLVSSFAQNIWNIGLGMIATIIFLRNAEHMESYLYLSGLFVSLIFFALIVLLYYNIGLINTILKKLTRFSLVRISLQHLHLLNQYKNKELTSVFFLSLLRYLIYVLQYYLILRFFGLHLSYVNAAVGIATIFLIQTSIPLPPIIGFLARGEIALMVWQYYELNEISVLASSYTLWAINLILPSLLGAGIIFTSNLSRTFGLNRNYFK